jgi:predicted ATP-grasp superfamily ATP-dependent carboligase
VLVTEAGERGALAACRSLAAAGYQVAAVADTRLAAGHWSRACAERLLAPDAKREPAAFAAAIADIAQSGRYAALVPGGEASLLAISQHGRGMEDAVRIGLPPHEVVERSLDKVSLLDEAAAAGMPAPPSVVCTTSDEAVRAAEELGYPVVLKPPRTVVDAAIGRRQQRIVLASGSAHVEASAGSMSAPFIVQRFEPVAERLSCAGVRVDDRISGLAVAHFKRMWPPLAGAASFAETVRPRPDLVGGVEALLRAIGWQGIFELEVLALPDGSLATMDLNPRLFGWLALAVRSGADLPAIWCNRLLGRSRASEVARPGVRYRWEDAEACNLLWLLSRRRVGAAADVLRPRRGVVNAHFLLRDPGPMLARSAEAVARRVNGRRLARADVGEAAPGVDS